MKARITEKIAKTYKITLLKHTPCRVVGWKLDARDREKSEESQRRLNYLPTCIFIQFQGATWKIHPNLPPGVFPFVPVEREWKLNKHGKSKVKRRGYTLLPDCGCTSHLVQGETLEAELADCGDIDHMPPLKDMLSAYVVLSRVKKAIGLLLLRAFSLLLFKHGPPPGPHCLMKLLRSRLSPDRKPFVLHEMLGPEIPPFLPPTRLKFADLVPPIGKTVI